MREGKSFQIVCPKCKHEFRYDTRYYDANIAALNSEISEMREQLTEYKSFPAWKKREWESWRKQLLHRYDEKLAELRDLKTLRKNLDSHVDGDIDRVFRALVKERLGETEYIKLREQAEKDCEAYSVASTMKHEYTHSGGQNIRRYGK